MSHDIDQRLIDMLSYRRPHDSDTELEFTKRFIDPYDPGRDEFGNMYINVGAWSRTLFTCHVDTVHHKPGRQKLGYVESEGLLVLADKESNCLGADDAAGVWVMLNMIDAGIPGTYLFHRAEERGGQGSKWIEANWPTWLEAFDRAVAFDRRGTNSVITHQLNYERGCSSEFANALCAQLGRDWYPDDSGIFTDTAFYFSRIPECTNISTAYEDEHSEAESLNWPALRLILGQVLAVKWDDLPVRRTLTQEVYDCGYASYEAMTEDQAWDLVERDPDIAVQLLMRAYGKEYDE